VVFLITLGGSLLYVWLREPLYQATASVLTVAPAPIDQAESDVNSQHVAVQRQILLGMPVLQGIQRRLNEEWGSEAPAPLTDGTLRDMLSVEPVPETNLVELRARGPNPAQLALVVNAWTDAYQEFREQSIRESKANTSAALEEEFEQLGRKIETKRRELEDFRRAHNILTKKDTDNQAMARLNGLTASLNQASDKEVLAKAKLDALKEAIARGEPVAPPDRQQGLRALEQRAQELREMVKDLKRRYTPQYVALEPQLKLIPEQLAQTEAAIRAKLEDSKHMALSEAEQAYASARQSVQDIRRQIEVHKREAAEFTARFAEHQAMTADLEQLEVLYRETQSRLAHIQAKPTEKIPQLQVVESAYQPTTPVWPNYWRDSGIALLASLGAALLMTWLCDYLMRREPLPAPARLPDIRVFSIPERLAFRFLSKNLPAARQEKSIPILTEDTQPALTQVGPRELAEVEIHRLLEAAALETRQLLGFLLSGLTLEETAGLKTDNFDFEHDRLHLTGDFPRDLPLAPRLKTWLMEIDPKPAYSSTTQPDRDELAALIACAAVDAGIAEPGSVNADALRHTYIIYLVRQGIRTADLERIVGKLPAKIRAGYAQFSPPGPGLRVESVPLVFPALRAHSSDYFSS
jgi:uncharacterized protein involved in exopolysaccharide biosynthesis